MNAEKKCPTCGAPVSAEAVEGLCARCLARLAFAAAPTGDEISEQRRLGDYDLLEEIARGGMGVVYRARQLSLNRIVAVKVVLNGPFSSPEFIRRFQTEAEAAAALKHPNIVAIYEVGAHGDSHFLSMEFVEGQNFAALVRNQPLAARRAAHYLQIIALALQHAHERGVLHRDLKPSNLLLDVFDQPRVTDFGLAKLANREAELTVPGSVLGSPNFIPPEQAAGNYAQIAAPSDVYSLGAVLYQLLTGRPPFQGETLHEILQQVQNAEPVAPRKLNPSVPLDLQNICLKCLQKEPARRYATAQALAEDLEFFLAGKPVRARPVSMVEKSWLWCKRRPALASLILALHLALFGGLAGIIYEWRRANLHAQGELQQRLAAEKNALTTRLNLYAADVALASQVMQQGDFGRARRTLEQIRPPPGETDLRGFEWRYLWNRCRGNELVTLGEHGWIVTCVAYSPDGKIIASGGMDGHLKIWEVASRQLLRDILADSGTLWTLVFTRDGHTLLAGGTSGVQLRDTISWLVQTNFPGRMATLSAEGKLLAISESSRFFFDESGPVSLWDFRTKKKLRTLDRPGRFPALTPDGRLLAVAGETTGFRLYETASGKLLRTFSTEKPVWTLNFSADGTELISAGWSGDVSIWRVDDDRPAQIFSANNLNVWDASYSPDGKSILTTSSDQSIRFWDRATLTPKNILHGHASEVWCAAFSPDGHTLVTGGKDQQVMLWPAQPPVAPPEIPHENVVVPIFSPDSTQLITVNPEPIGAYALWSVGEHKKIGNDLAQRHELVGFSADGKYFVAMAADKCRLEFWLPNASQPARTVRLEGCSLTKDFAFCGMSPDGKYFFGIDDTGMVRVWALAAGNLIAKLAGPLPPIRNAILSPAGTFLAVSIERQNIFFLFDCASGKKTVLNGHHDFISGLAFSPDSAVLATGSMDGTIGLWTTKDAQPAGMLPGHLQETTDVAFSPDGRTLASISEGESLKLWNLATRREVFSEALPHAGSHLKFSPDGRHLAVNLDDGKLLLLDAPQ